MDGLHPRWVIRSKNDCLLVFCLLAVCRRLDAAATPGCGAPILATDLVTLSSPTSRGHTAERRPLPSGAWRSRRSGRGRDGGWLTPTPTSSIGAAGPLRCDHPDGGMTEGHLSGYFRTRITSERNIDNARTTTHGTANRPTGGPQNVPTPTGNKCRFSACIAGASCFRPTVRGTGV